mgnify:CR=1 FL=1
MENKIKINKSYTKFIMQIFIMIFAGLVGGCAFKTFFESVGIIPTGLSGLSLIIHNLFVNSNIEIPTSIIYLIINAVIFLIALKVFGWKFLLLSGVGIGSYTLAMQFGDFSQIFNLTTESPDRLLCVIVGGLLMGLSIGVALRFGGSTGGSDIAGALLNKFFPKIKTGYCLLGINVIVIILSVTTTGNFMIGLYAVVSTIISSMATNLVLDDSKQVVAFYIICDKPKEIADAILEKFKRGVTKIDAQGMFSHKEKTMLLSLIPKGQAHEMKKLIKVIDNNAFVYSSTVTETLGDGDFMKEQSIFKNKVNISQNQIKSPNRYNLLKKPKQTLKQSKIKLRKKYFQP